MRGFRLLPRALPGFLCLFASALALAAGGINTAIPQIQATRNLTLCAVAAGRQEQALAQSLDEFRQAALSWNVEITLLPYRDSFQAAADFRKGLCDLVNLPGTQVLPFNPFTATLEALGALPGEEYLSLTLQALALEKANHLMRHREYEVVSVWPAGARYIWVAERDLQAPAALTGRTLSSRFAPQPMALLADITGMKVVKGKQRAIADLKTRHTDEDIPDGYAGVLSLPMNQRTWQLIAHQNALPAGFGTHARQFAEQYFDKLHQRFSIGEQRWPASYWIKLDPQQRADWQQIYQKVRLRLRDEGVYDAAALSLLRKVRCALDSSQLECGGGPAQVE